jgi:vancomycin permeability regulator SanA
MKKRQIERRQERRPVKRIWKRLLVTCLCLILAGTLSVAGINIYMYADGARRLETEESTFEAADCIMVLGCKVQPDGRLSHMLEDRLKRGVALYKAGAAPKLLMSGDHGQVEYNEVAAMRQYAIDQGVPSEDIFMDHAGFSTYESLYRARDVFQVDRIIIVTQEYHLYRALHIAKSLGLESWGVSSDYRSYSGQFARDVREVLARVKDFGTSIFQPKPTYLGEPIPITGSGDATHD